MSFPILYESNATNFFNNGIGVLTDTISANVTTERNGIFELEMSYPITGRLFSYLKNGRVIKADSGQEIYTKDQRFRIVKITKPLSGIVTVYAQHVSYLTNKLTLKPVVTINDSDATIALGMWKSSIVDKNEFVVDSDITTKNSAAWSIKTQKNAREALGGVAGSILQNWGGEYIFDNYHISLKNRRGKTSAAILAYGKNITEFS